MKFDPKFRRIIDALPINLPPTQVISLVSLVAAWIDRFDFSICTGTTLCSKVFDIGVRALSIAQHNACRQAQSFIDQKELFLARDALTVVMNLASRLVEMSETAKQAMVPGETYPAVAFTIKFGVELSIVIVSGRGRSFERLPLKIALQQD